MKISLCLHQPKVAQVWAVDFNNMGLADHQVREMDLKWIKAGEAAVEERWRKTETSLNR